MLAGLKPSRFGLRKTARPTGKPFLECVAFRLDDTPHLRATDRVGKNTPPPILGATLGDLPFRLALADLARFASVEQLRFG